MTFVKTKKIQLLLKAVNEYVISNDLDVEVRFDIIAIHKKEKNFDIEHLKDAFYHFLYCYICNKLFLLLHL